MNAPASNSNTATLAVCLLTGASRGAVATVALEGGGAGELISRCFQPAAAGPIRMGHVRYGLWQRSPARELAAESVVVTRNPDRSPADRLAAGTTITSAARGAAIQSWEVHCHGGVAAASRIIDDLQLLGATVLAPEVWQQWRGEPLLTREACEVLRLATSARTAAIALDQVRGAMSDFAQLALHRPLAGGRSWRELSATAAEYLCYAPAGLHIVSPWRVVLAGPPNVGKSSLINALLGYRRSITLDQPGTTRDVVEAETIIEGWPIRLSDTAGIHDQPQCDIEQAGIRLAQGELQQADLILWVCDATSSAALEVPAVSDFPTGAAVLQVVNKIDLLGEVAATPRDAISTSAATGQGVDKLRLRIVQALVPSVPPPGSPVPVTQRQVDCLRRLACAHSEAAAIAALQSLRTGQQ